MSEWVDAVAEGTLMPGEHANIEVDGTYVAVFYIEGEYWAIEDTCTHDGGELADGALDGFIIECPRHGAEFCIKTGKAMSTLAYRDIQTYQVRVENGIVQVSTRD